MLRDPMAKVPIAAAISRTTSASAAPPAAAMRWRLAARQVRARRQESAAPTNSGAMTSVKVSRSPSSPAATNAAAAAKVHRPDDLETPANTRRHQSVVAACQPPCSKKNESCGPGRARSATTNPAPAKIPDRFALGG